MPAPRRLLSRLRDLTASGAAPLAQLVGVVAAEMVCEVCSVYVLRPGEILELVATEGLAAEAIGHTRLRVGEGIVGLAAATHQVLNLPDAQNHPAFVYRAETREEAYASMLAVPVRRAGRTLGVLVVQNRAPRRYDTDDVEAMETVAMLLAEMLASSGVAEAQEEGLLATVPRRFTGSCLAVGLAMGPIVVLGPSQGPQRILADDPDKELARLDQAVADMQAALDRLIESRLPKAARAGEQGQAAREVLDAYRMVAADTGWLKRVAAAIRSGLSAEAAVQRVAGDLRDRMRKLVDPYLRERLADIEDMVGRLMAALSGGSAMGAAVPGGILLVRRLGPAELLDWHARGSVGTVVEDASPSGHAAILARALGLPMLGGARGVIEAAEDGDLAVLDAEDGRVVLRPDADVRRAYERALQAQTDQQAGYASLRDLPTETRDGTRVRLLLNVGLALELPQLDITGADGIGLFRTEIAMLARGAVSDQAEQTALYARVLDAAGPREVIFRTLDLGGDKLLPGSGLAQDEATASMGWRSLRVGLERPALLRRQLRAMLLAAQGRELSVMFPMVATVAEFRAASSLLRTEAARVRPAPARLRVGTMLEVPALLWQLPVLVQELDFISIGSNDLLQFLFAADRGSPELAARYDLLSPPVLDVLEHVVAHCARAGVALSLCGEHSARRLEAMVLIGMGITSLSMPANALLKIKAMLSGVDLPALRRVLASIRATAAGEASLREPIMAWAREHGVSL